MCSQYANFSAETLETFLDDLASGRPVPGGGSASALAAAAAAGLVAMTCRLTLGRGPYREHDDTMNEVLIFADRLREAALHLVSEDTQAYSAVNTARTLPRETEEQKAERTARIQEALKGATRVPLNTARTSARILINCESIADKVNVHTISDLGVGALLAHAALDGAALSVRTNLTLIKDEAFNATMSTALTRLEPARSLLDEVLHTIKVRQL